MNIQSISATDRPLSVTPILVAIALGVLAGALSNPGLLGVVDLAAPQLHVKAAQKRR